MANKRLSLDQIEQMKMMVIQGTAPEDIANHFNVAISSVHNYKTRFKEQGVVFPSVRGQRPTGSVESKLGRIDQISPNSNLSLRSFPTSSQLNSLTVVVNGVTFIVNDEAREVIVNKNKVEIKY